MVRFASSIAANPADQHVKDASRRRRAMREKVAEIRVHALGHAVVQQVASRAEGAGPPRCAPAASRTWKWMPRSTRRTSAKAAVMENVRCF